MLLRSAEFEDDFGGNRIRVEQCAQRTVLPSRRLTAGAVVAMVVVPGICTESGWQAGGTEDDRAALVQRRRHIAWWDCEAAGERQQTERQ